MSLRFFLVVISAFVLVYSVLTLAQIGVAPENLCSLKFPKWFGCVLVKHDGLAGGLLGAAGTIVAGWIAWVAVGRQIANAEKLQTRREDETYRVVQAELIPHVKIYNQIWRVVDKSIAADEFQILDNGIKFCRTIAPFKPNYAAIETSGGELDPFRRRRLVDVINALRYLEGRVSEHYQSETDQHVSVVEKRQYALIWLHTVRAVLTTFQNALVQFDPNAANIFAGRVKVELDNRPEADQFEALIQHFEQHGTPFA